MVVVVDEVVVEEVDVDEVEVVWASASVTVVNTPAKDAEQQKPAPRRRRHTEESSLSERPPPTWSGGGAGHHDDDDRAPPRGPGNGPRSPRPEAGLVAGVGVMRRPSAAMSGSTWW